MCVCVYDLHYIIMCNVLFRNDMDNIVYDIYRVQFTRWSEDSGTAASQFGAPSIAASVELENRSFYLIYNTLHRNTYSRYYNIVG